MLVSGRVTFIVGFFPGERYDDFDVVLRWGPRNDETPRLWGADLNRPKVAGEWWKKNNDVWQRPTKFPPEILRIYYRFKNH